MLFSPSSIHNFKRGHPCFAIISSFTGRSHRSYVCTSFPIQSDRFCFSLTLNFIVSSTDIKVGKDGNMFVQFWYQTADTASMSCLTFELH